MGANFQYISPVHDEEAIVTELAREVRLSMSLACEGLQSMRQGEKDTGGIAPFLNCIILRLLELGVQVILNALGPAATS